MHGSRTTVIAVLFLTLFTAVAHGVATNRWNGGDAAPNRPIVPANVGDWIGHDMESNVDDPALANVTRNYVHKKSGRSFVVSITAGHPGLTAAHTPEYCYRGSGYEQVAPIERRAVTSTTPGEFWTTAFKKSSAAGAEQLRIFWAWSAGERWVAPDYPRVHFMGKPKIHKLYVVALGNVDATPGQDPALDEFLASFLAALRQSLSERSAA